MQREKKQTANPFELAVRRATAYLQVITLR